MDSNSDKKLQTDYEKELEKYSTVKTVLSTDETKSQNPIAKLLIPKPDVIYLKLFPEDHPLSVEEQLFFIKVTEGVFGYNEQVRNETIKMLAIDYNITTITPYLCLFIKEAIYTNIALTDLTLLIYSVRMTKSLLSNPHIDVKEHIHHVLPAVLSCVLARKISRYYYDNHWTLRDFSAYVVAMICHMYNSQLNNMTQRVINMYVTAIQDPNKPLTTIYGAIKGLSNLGEDIVKMYLFPCIRFLNKRIYIVLEKKPIYPDDKQLIIEAKHIRDIIVNIISPILFKTQNVNDGGAAYIKNFGYLGKLFYYQVKSLETIEMSQPTSNFVYLINSAMNINLLGQGNFVLNK